MGCFRLVIRVGGARRPVTGVPEEWSSISREGGDRTRLTGPLAHFSSSARLQYFGGIGERCTSRRLPFFLHSKMDRPVSIYWLVDFLREMRCKPLKFHVKALTPINAHAIPLPCGDGLWGPSMGMAGVSLCGNAPLSRVLFSCFAHLVPRWQRGGRDEVRAAIPVDVREQG